jgi:hypothetical protein
VSDEAARKAFSRDLEALRHQRDCLEPTEAARRELDAGLSAHEALFQIQDHFEYRNIRSGGFVDAVALFVSSLCEQEFVAPDEELHGIIALGRDAE